MTPSIRICFECASFDTEMTRTDERSLVRCMDERNRDGLRNKLIRAGQKACRHFAEKQRTNEGSGK